MSISAVFFHKCRLSGVNSIENKSKMCAAVNMCVCKRLSKIVGRRAYVKRFVRNVKKVCGVSKIYNSKSFIIKCAK